MTAKKTPAAAATAATEGTLKAFDEAVAASKTTVENAVKATTEAASEHYEKAVSLTKEQVEAAVKAGDGLVKQAEDLTSFNRETLDLVVKSSTLLVQGWQDVAKSAMATLQASIEESIAHSKAVASAKSIHELVELNQTFAKTSVEKAIAEATRLSETSTKLLEEASKPLAGRFEQGIEKFVKPLAA